jgi:hypothetical protein
VTKHTPSKNLLHILPPASFSDAPADPVEVALIDSPKEVQGELFPPNEDDGIQPETPS